MHAEVQGLNVDRWTSRQLTDPRRVPETVEVGPIGKTPVALLQRRKRRTKFGAMLRAAPRVSAGSFRIRPCRMAERSSPIGPVPVRQSAARSW
jgi:hypothetical protein